MRREPIPLGEETVKDKSVWFGGAFLIAVLAATFGAGYLVGAHQGFDADYWNARFHVLERGHETAMQCIDVQCTRLNRLDSRMEAIIRLDRKP